MVVRRRVKIAWQTLRAEESDQLIPGATKPVQASKSGLVTLWLALLVSLLLHASSTTSMEYNNDP